MVKLKCEQCDKEFDRPRPQPYCCSECFKIHEVKKKTEYMNDYTILSQDKFYKVFLDKANRQGKRFEFEKTFKNEVLKGTHKAFEMQGFYGYIMNKIMDK